MENASMQRHSSRIIALHWLTLALLGGAFVLGKAVTQARESGSVTLTDCSGIWWRACWYWPPLRCACSFAGATACRRRCSRVYQARRWVHRGLYAVLITVPLSGMAGAQQRHRRAYRRQCRAAAASLQG